MKKILFILLTSISTLSGYAQSIHLVINKESEQIQFAAHEIKLSLIEKGLSVDVYSISDINKVSILSMQPTPGGTILEAEDLDVPEYMKLSQTSGFSGMGYIAFQHGQPEVNPTWKFNAPEEGKYLLEFRYSLRREEPTPSSLEINGKKIAYIDFWTIGDETAWINERIAVDLEKGENAIHLKIGRFAFIDHLNIIQVKYGV